MTLNCVNCKIISFNLSAGPDAIDGMQQQTPLSHHLHFIWADCVLCCCR